MELFYLLQHTYSDKGKVFAAQSFWDDWSDKALFR